MSVGSIDAVRHSRDWASQGACVQRDPDDFFVTGAEQNKAKVVCRECPVQRLCLADALDNQIEFGVWGGMTERERRRLSRDYPHVRNWLPLLERSEIMDRAVRKKVMNSGRSGAAVAAGAPQLVAGAK